jgi:hypothetical protein
MMRLLVGEAEGLSGAERGAMERHLAECPACTQALGELRAVKEQGAREAPPLPLPAPRPRRRASIALGSLALAGAAAAALLWIRIPPGDGIRPKGASRIAFACKDGARVWDCRSGETVRPGTAVGVGVDLAEPRWVMLLGRDETGIWRIYLPSQGEEALPLQRGETDPLGPSLVLDDRPGEERFVVVLAPHPFARRELRGEGVGQPLELPEGFESRELTLRK